MTYPCPHCGVAADLANGCPGCGAPPDVEAAEVIAIDEDLPALRAAAATARSALLTAQEIDSAAQHALSVAEGRRHALVTSIVARIRAGSVTSASPAVVAAGSASTLAVTAPAAAAPTAVVAVRPETSTRTVQTVLFVLGGLLLGSAAIVFTAVAWVNYGVAVRAGILAVLTVMALAAPVVALRRSLTGTAETFAALGLLLVVLDGYAAWYANLFHVADRVDPSTYLAVVAAVATAIGAGYAALTGLRAARIAALVTGQFVAPAIAGALHCGLPGWAAAFAVTAAADAALAARRTELAARRTELAASRTELAARGTDLPRRTDLLRVLSWCAHWAALAVSGLVLFAALTFGDNGAWAGLRAAAAALAVVGALLVGAYLNPAQRWRTAAEAIAVIVLAWAVGRLAAALLPGHAVLIAALVTALSAAGVAAFGPRLPDRAHRGIWTGAAILTAAMWVAGLCGAIVAGFWTVSYAFPGQRPHTPWHWAELAAVVLLTLAGLLLVPPPWRRADPDFVLAIRQDVLFAAVVPAALILGWAVPMPGWAAPLLHIVAAGALLQVAVRTTGGYAVLLRTGGALTLAGIAFLGGLGRPWTVAVVALVVVAAGLLAVLRALPGGLRTPVAGAALAGAVLAWPVAVVAGLDAMRVETWWICRATMLAVAVLVVAMGQLIRRWPQYRLFSYVATLLVLAVLPSVASANTHEPGSVYAGLTIVFLVMAVIVARGRPLRAIPAAAPALLWWALTCVPAILDLLAAPYGWLAHIWSGRPRGIGLDAGLHSAVTFGHVVAVLLLAVAVAALALDRFDRDRARWLATPVAAFALPLLLAAAHAPWPTVSLTCLLLGLAGFALAAYLPVGLWSLPTVAVAGLLAGPGLSGLLATRALTITGLALTLVVGVGIAAIGHNLGTRLAGCLGSAGVLVLLASAIAAAAGATMHVAALAVLAAAAIIFAVGARLRPVRPAESTALDLSSYAAAVVALLLTVGSAEYAAIVCALWAAALGIRAGAPTEPRRRAFVVAAAAVALFAWWFALLATDVHLLEAYTVPAALVALAVGGWITYNDRSISSWITFGPGLLVGFLPSLGAMVGDAPLRRLLLGVAALAVVLAGAASRRQAPVVLGGATLALVALHELTELWDLLPRWIPLALAGLLLVGVATTVERRRRDLARLGAALRQMT